MRKIKKSKVTTWLNTSMYKSEAAYVVAHARRQYKKDKSPSCTYKGERNPKRALKLAINDLKQHEPMWGENYLVSLKRIVKLTSLIEHQITLIFNGVVMSALPGSTYKELVALFDQCSKLHYQKWQRSPEGRQCMRNEMMMEHRRQKKVDALLIRLNELDFNNLTEIIKWLRKYEAVGGYIGIEAFPAHVAETFIYYGYFPNVAPDKPRSFYDDKYASAYYIIGQAINFLQKGNNIHQVCSTLADWWLEKHAA